MSSSDWSAGYVADVNYTAGYYTELNPLRGRLALLNQGYRPPDVRTACELGFGQGLSVAVHAAASPVQWWGTDFNPSQAAFANSLNAASGTGARLFDEAFEEFVRRPDLPEFDYIGLHGIWSWISDENRGVIVDFIRRKLRPGGLLYISYNASPAWSAFVPFRHMLTEHAALSGTSKSRTALIDEALGFAERLIATNPVYTRANPQVAERIKTMKGQDRRYLAHEFFNRDWHPMAFDQVARLLGQAKMSYVASAHMLDHVPALNLTAEQQAFLAEIPDSTFQEVVRDLLINQQFRRDYWVKGPIRLSTLEKSEALGNERVVLMTPRSKVSLKVRGALGEGSLNEPVYAPILDALADHRPRSLGELARTVEAKGVSAGQVVEALVVLMSGSTVGPAQTDAAIRASKASVDRLNAYIRSAARSSAEIGHLATPVTGGALGVTRFEQMFLNAVDAGRKTPQELAEAAWGLIASQGQKLVKEGVTLETDEANLAELQAQASEFLEMGLPMLRALGAAPAGAAKKT